MVACEERCVREWCVCNPLGSGAKGRKPILIHPAPYEKFGKTWVKISLLSDWLCQLYSGKKAFRHPLSHAAVKNKERAGRGCVNSEAAWQWQ